MQLAPGHRLGPYEILGPLGAGGMGEVYRARDTRLDRAVAVKVLAEGTGIEESQRARFAREAKAISALSHPHICTLFDVGSEGGFDYLVMELLEGETVAELLRKGRLPEARVIRYGIEIADALEKAHSAGIIHRDLKPGNLMVTRSGVKLLDFGLADLRPSPRTGTESTTSPMAGERLTQRGMIVGTLDFMAPEQLDGRRADERSDIFSLGNVLYRMAAGHAPFAGSSEAAVAAAILNDDPPFPRHHRPDLSPPLERIILDCLKKDPADRFQSAHDVKLALQSAAAHADRPVPDRPAWRLLPWVMALLGIGMAAALYWNRPEPQAASRDVRRFTIDLPDLPPAYDWANREFAISPDGSRIVVGLNVDGEWRLHVRRFDRLDFEPLPATENASNPFFSPDGQWIGFTSAGKLRKMLTGGGPVIDLADAPRLRGASWGSDGTIVFAAVSSGEGLSEVPAEGGTPKRITSLDRTRNEYSHRWPHFLPDPRYVLYSVDDWSADYGRKKVAMLDRTTGRTAILIHGGTDPRYFNGYLLFAKERSLHSVRLDVESMSIVGLPVPVLESVVTHAGIGSISAEVAQNGTLVYVRYDPTIAERTLMWVDRDGQTRPLNAVRRPYTSPRLSPDEKQLLVGSGEARATDLWILDLQAGSWSRIAEEGKSLAPVWSPDGTQIFFSSNREGPYNIFAIRSDGSGPARRITSSEHWPFARAISPDGRKIVAEEQNPLTSYDIWEIQSDGSGARPILASAANENHPDLSPDGRWIVYHSTESGRSEIYVQQFPPSGRKWKVSDTGGIRPRWSPHGDEILYWSGQRMMSARAKLGTTLSIGRPERLFEGDYGADYDVTADGRRFVMLRASPRAREGGMAVVLNWQRELETRTNEDQRR